MVLASFRSDCHPVTPAFREILQDVQRHRKGHRTEKLDQYADHQTTDIETNGSVIQTTGARWEAKEGPWIASQGRSRHLDANKNLPPRVLKPHVITATSRAQSFVASSSEGCHLRIGQTSHASVPVERLRTTRPIGAVCSVILCSNFVSCFEFPFWDRRGLASRRQFVSYPEDDQQRGNRQSAKSGGLSQYFQPTCAARSHVLPSTSKMPVGHSSVLVATESAQRGEGLGCSILAQLRRQAVRAPTPAPGAPESVATTPFQGKLSSSSSHPFSHANDKYYTSKNLSTP